jgi:hypothetical protein
MTLQSIRERRFAQSQRQFARCKALSVSFASLAFGLGLAVLLGWLFDIDLLKRIHPSLVSMKANTAVCLMLIASSVLLLEDRLASPLRRRVAYVFAAFVGVVGLLSLSEHLFGWDLRIDQLLFTSLPQKQVNLFLVALVLPPRSTSSSLVLRCCFWMCALKDGFACQTFLCSRSW